LSTVRKLPGLGRTLPDAGFRIASSTADAASE